MIKLKNEKGKENPSLELKWLAIMLSTKNMVDSTGIGLLENIDFWPSKEIKQTIYAKFSWNLFLLVWSKKICDNLDFGDCMIQLYPPWTRFPTIPEVYKILANMIRIQGIHLKPQENTKNTVLVEKQLSKPWHILKASFQKQLRWGLLLLKNMYL